MHALASGFHAAKRLKQTSGAASSSASSNPPLAPYAPWLRRLEDMGRLVHRRALLQRSIASAHKLNSEDAGSVLLPRTSMTDDEALAALRKGTGPSYESTPPPPRRNTPSPVAPCAPPPVAPPISQPAEEGVIGAGTSPTSKPKKRKQPRCIVTEPKDTADLLGFEIVDLGLIEGLFPGDDLLVISPSNQRVRVKSPVGVKPGQYFRLQVRCYLLRQIILYHLLKLLYVHFYYRSRSQPNYQRKFTVSIYSCCTRTTLHFAWLLRLLLTG